MVHWLQCGIWLYSLKHFACQEHCWIVNVYRHFYLKELNYITTYFAYHHQGIWLKGASIHAYSIGNSRECSNTKNLWSFSSIYLIYFCRSSFTSLWTGSQNWTLWSLLVFLPPDYYIKCYFLLLVAVKQLKLVSSRSTGYSIHLLCGS